jgi:hypothetical protein
MTLLSYAVVHLRFVRKGDCHATCYATPPEIGGKYFEGDRHDKEKDNLRHIMCNELIMRVWTTFNGELYACDETGLNATWISNSKKKEERRRNNEMCNSET